MVKSSGKFLTPWKMGFRFWALSHVVFSKMRSSENGCHNLEWNWALHLEVISRMFLAAHWNFIKTTAFFCILKHQVSEPVSCNCWDCFQLDHGLYMCVSCSKVAHNLAESIYIYRCCLDETYLSSSVATPVRMFKGVRQDANSATLYLLWIPENRLSDLAFSVKSHVNKTIYIIYRYWSMICQYFPPKHEACFLVICVSLFHEAWCQDPNRTLLFHPNPSGWLTSHSKP